MSLSQEDRILLILLDGGWHSTREILRQVPSIVHSRIAGLRDKGFTVEHRTLGPGAAGSQYRLIALEGKDDAASFSSSAPLAGTLGETPREASAYPVRQPPTGQTRPLAQPSVPASGARPAHARPDGTHPISSGCEPLPRGGSPAGQLSFGEEAA